MNINKKLNCHDCKEEIIVVGEEIENGVMLNYDTGAEKITVFKCNTCFGKNQELKNYQPCEVYSRVVGYIRPVQQWHKGKKQEYQERSEYKTKES
ncbi:MAG: anaerobic ribonucleoside-triphosphate reductase [Candidatus Staskawiczbacteria bacterium]|jgi:hypothetical protein